MEFPFDKQIMKCIIYNSKKHFRSLFTHTLLQFCFSKILNCSQHVALNKKTEKQFFVKRTILYILL
jgi:hypothetical protein